jgi:predicted ATPase
MLISKISLSNFKNFEHIDVTLGDMNVIVGANASGKSNFIQALKFIQNIKDFGIDNAISLGGGINYLRNFQVKKNKNTSISISFSPPTGGTIIDRVGSEFLLLEYNNITYTIEIAAINGKKYEVVKEEIVYDTKIMQFDSKKSIINNTLLDNFRFIVSSKKGKVTYTNPIKGHILSWILSNGITKKIDSDDITPFPVSKSFFDNFNGNNQDKKTLIEQFSFLFPMDIVNFSVYDFDLKKAKESTPITGKVELEENGENLAIVIKNILENKEKTRQFSNLLTDILPFIKGLNVETFYDKSLLFKVKEIYNANTHLPSSLLSDGTISVTAIVTALFFEDKKLMVFEEPEQGIHPALIAKLMQYFYDASKYKQVIITTHSPEILKHTQLNDLLLISRNNNGFAHISKPIEQEMVTAFLENELGIDQLFIQNLLDA